MIQSLVIGTKLPPKNGLRGKNVSAATGFLEKLVNNIMKLRDIHFRYAYCSSLLRSFCIKPMRMREL